MVMYYDILIEFSGTIDAKVPSICDNTWKFKKKRLETQGDKQKGIMLKITMSMKFRLADLTRVDLAILVYCKN